MERTSPRAKDAFRELFQGIASSASVAATTCATDTPGAVSSNVARPLGNPITAISLTTRSTGRTDVSGRVQA